MKIPTKSKSVRIKPEIPFKPWAVILPTLLVATVHDANALQLDIRNHWVRDYLDLAQNKGVFERGATGIEIMRKDGTILKLPDVPFPDMGVVANQGSSTSIGGAYSVTATHNKKYGPWHVSVGKPEWGKTTYYAQSDIHVDHQSGRGDFSAIRLDKFVVETRGVEGIETNLTDAEFVERYGVMYDGKKQVIAYRAGSGMFSLQDKNGKTDYRDVSYKPELLGGSFFTLRGQGRGSEWIDFQNFKSLSNTTTTGDSGSGVLIWDNQKQKWVIAGVLFGILGNSQVTFFRYGKWNQKVVDELKARHTHKIALANQTLTFDDTEMRKYSIGQAAAETFGDKKDLSFTGGGTINLKQNLHLGIGGLIFDSNNDYIVNGDAFSYKGAGIDIGKGSTLQWNVTGVANENLHKIGEGTLEVNVTQGGNLKVGDGKVILKADKSFNNIYMANGYATVKLDTQNALNTGDGRNGIFFARHGGTLDINGFSQTFERIAASDEGAIVTNTANQIANINFKLPKWSYAYHGQFKGKLNVNHKFADAVSDEIKHKERHLILDGNVDIDGDLSVQNAKLTMQGLPVTHSYFGVAKCGNPAIFPCQRDYVQNIKDKEQADNNKYGSHYKSNNQINSFDQPDWKQRTFKFKNLNLDNAALGVGRNTTLLTDINAVSSTIQFGGDVATFRDNHAGDNVTGFDFRQNLIEGKSIDNESIYYEGAITARDSKITSYAKTMAASFDLSDNSVFEAKDKDSVTRILDAGIKVKDSSKLILGDIFVEKTKRDIVIEKDDNATLSIEDVIVTEASLTLPDGAVKGSLNAYKDASINVKNWTLTNNNLASHDNGVINIKSLEVLGKQDVGSANIYVKDRMVMKDVNPNSLNSNDSGWVGLNVNELTFGRDSQISAEFSNDFLSLANLSLDKEHTLIQANKLTDDRLKSKIDFTLQGKAVNAISKIDGNKISFTLKDSYFDPDHGNGGPGFGKPEDDKLLNDFFYSPVGYEFLEQNKSENAVEVITSILEHNASSPNKYQEAAIKDALSMTDVEAGVEALNNIVSRTETSFDKTAKNINQDTLTRPIRNVVDSRLASLRRGAYKGVAQYAPVAALGDSFDGAKISDHKIANNSVYMDMSGGIEKNGSYEENVLSSNVGYDHVLKLGNDRLVLGAAGTVTQVNKKDVGSKDEGLMYSLSGYLSFEQKEGFELQSYLTAGYLMNDRTFIPEISLGEQKFDEKSWVLMSSNYFKYHFRTGNLSIKPMLLADVGWNKTSDSESTYFKREGFAETTVDFGAGLEIEGFNEDMGYLFQFTAKKNIYSSEDSVGINLKNSDGFISYGLSERNDIRFSANAMISKRISTDIMMDFGIGATANTNGAYGLNANSRIRWLF